jgi:hypothetical protein
VGSAATSSVGAEDFLLHEESKTTPKKNKRKIVIRERTLFLSFLN